MIPTLFPYLCPDNPALVQLDHLGDRLESSLAAELRALVEALRSDLTTARNEVTKLAQAQADAIVHTAMLMSQLQEAQDQARKMEERIQQGQKLESLGRLAGGVAHDFNNLLTVITGYCDMLLLNKESDHPEYHMLVEVRKAGDRAAALTRQLLAFARKQIIAPQVINLNAVLVNWQPMMRRLLRENVTVHTDLASELFAIKMDPVQVEMILLNLVTNANDAMPDGGHLTIQTRNVDLDVGFLQGLPDLRPGSYVLLTVSDTGCGMDEWTRAHIFEPFFTTKALGKGTGLGLATVYGIVQQSHGHLSVYSEVGLGTTFKIYFPAVEDSTEIRERSTQKACEGPTGNEVVLLVEDEPSVRALANVVLRQRGYSVLEAPHGPAALEIFKQRTGPIHLLLTDLVMPEMSGRHLAELLRKQQPDLQVLFMSGYTDNVVVRQGIQENTVAFLPKPFTPQDLARKVREVLDAPNAAQRGCAEAIC